MYRQGRALNELSGVTAELSLTGMYKVVVHYSVDFEKRAIRQDESVRLPSASFLWRTFTLPPYFSSQRLLDIW